MCVCVEGWGGGENEAKHMECVIQVGKWVIPCQINTKKYLTLTDLDETWFLHSVC